MLSKMKWLSEGLYFVVYWCLRTCIALRYRVQIEGLEDVKPKNPEAGTLFLPNHPAEIDPIFMMVVLWKPFRPRPLVIQYFFEMAMVAPFMRLVRALSMPLMDGSANKWKVHQVEKLFEEIVDGVRRKENFLMYPPGRLKLGAEEVLGGCSLTHSLLQEVPEANVVLVRTYGLWGSSFSRALTGKVPPFGKMLVHGVKHLLKNGLFFMPRRKVFIEFEVSETLPLDRGRLALNQALEKWYNAKGDDLLLVSYLFWKKSLPEVKVSKEGQLIHKKRVVPKEVQSEVLAMLAALSHKPQESIQESDDLWTDLGLDSLDMAKVHTFLDDSFNVGQLLPDELESVEDVLQAAVGRKKFGAAAEEIRRRLKWPKEGERQEPIFPVGESLQEVFLRSCDHMGKLTACSDALMERCMSYRRLKAAAIALSMEVKKLEGEYVGVMLPSSVAAYISILAALLAKKVPVMLNWTVGSRSLEHAAEVTALTTVLSSRRFLERVESVDLGAIESKLLFLEEFRKRLTLKEKLTAAYLATKSADHVLDRLDLRGVCEEQRAVVLFTSGTEALPKGVPLTHRNILSNHRSALQTLGATKEDVLLAVLPPFHSFGFSVTGLLPLLMGLKVCYAPDPTDGRQMAADVAHWKVTLLCSAPSFLQALLRVAKKGQLKSVRMVVSGAEKTPLELFEKVHSLPQAPELIEGYGITECSPIVTINCPGVPPHGVGRPIPGVELKVIHPETDEELPQGEDGEICIHGPNVFSGYLGIPKDPFIELKGRRWYRSGDFGHLDAEGNLILSGRLKRFVKMGAEMVGLGGIEEEVYKIGVEKGWIKEISDLPQVAVDAVEVDGEKPELVVYSTADLVKEELNAALRARGMGSLVKIAKVVKVEAIPVSATGKIQYRLLKK